MSKFGSLLTLKESTKVEEKPAKKISARATKPVITLTTSEKVAKRTDPEYGQLKVYIPKSLHLELKRASLEQSREQSEIVATALEKYLGT
jgi:hypothetical protein